MTPGVLVAGNFDDNGGDEEDTTGAAQTAPPKKPSVQVDDQLSKGLELLKAKAA